ncbi:glycine betaine/L-proline ABC transporter ATP-binding protein ProV [bacterium]|nr:glycine betaine/L-proline ABC transporter ATP-binding protein ProV [bacterium]
MNSSAKITVKNLYKIFGPNPLRALPLLNQGLTKEEILEKTGLTVGVQNANFSVFSGEIFVVMGLSGSGKSTLVRMLNRLIEPTSGSVFVGGDDVAKLSNKDLVLLRRRDMSMVFQSFALMPHMTVIENVAFGLELAQIDKKTRILRAMEALEQVGLESYQNSMPEELSGGMQQRVGLARGLAVDPEIILMDEAFSALDPLIKTEMQDELLALQSKHQRTIVFISHDLDEAMRIGDRIAIMEGGNIVQIGTPEEILQNPANEYVQAFFRGVDPTNILSAGDISRDTQVTIIRHPGEGPRAALQRLISHDRDYGYVLDSKRGFKGVVSTDSLKKIIETGSKDVSDAFLDNADSVLETDSLQDILNNVADNSFPVPVVKEDGKYIGVISKNIFLRTLQRDSGDHLNGSEKPTPIQEEATK